MSLMETKTETETFENPDRGMGRRTWSVARIWKFFYWIYCQIITNSRCYYFVWIKTISIKILNSVTLNRIRLKSFCHSLKLNRNSKLKSISMVESDRVPCLCKPTNLDSGPAFTSERTIFQIIAERISITCGMFGRNLSLVTGEEEENVEKYVNKKRNQISRIHISFVLKQWAPYYLPIYIVIWFLWRFVFSYQYGACKVKRENVSLWIFFALWLLFFVNQISCLPYNTFFM